MGRYSRVRHSYSAGHLHTHNRAFCGKLAWKQHFKLSRCLTFLVNLGSLNSTPSGRINRERISRAAKPEALSGTGIASRSTNLYDRSLVRNFSFGPKDALNCTVYQLPKFWHTEVERGVAGILLSSIDKLVGDAPFLPV